MRALKTLVVAMGIAIVIGASVLATLIFERGRRLAATVPDQGGAAGPTAAAERKLALPAGVRVLETRLEGGRIALRVALAGGGEAVFVFDGDSGRLIARYALGAEGGR